MIGIVYLVREPVYPGGIYTMKVMDLEKAGKLYLFNSMKREIDILTQIKGIPNVIELMDVFWNR
jgi:hypothetical protein